MTAAASVDETGSWGETALFWRLLRRRIAEHRAMDCKSESAPLILYVTWVLNSVWHTTSTTASLDASPLGGNAKSAMSSSSNAASSRMPATKTASNVGASSPLIDGRMRVRSSVITRRACLGGTRDDKVLSIGLPGSCIVTTTSHLCAEADSIKAFTLSVETVGISSHTLFSPRPGAGVAKLLGVLAEAGVTGLVTAFVAEGGGALGVLGGSGVLTTGASMMIWG